MQVFVVLIAAGLMATAVPLRAQSGADAPARLTRWLNWFAQTELMGREAIIRQVRGVEEARRRQEYVRSKALELMGGLPAYNGPLNPRSTAKLQRDGYVIEKVIYDSLPRYPVTANLYRPDRPGRFPGILFPMGHWESGKAAAQRMAANLARKGFVVLAFDPVGQGERLQFYDPRLGRSIAGGATDQHFMDGARSILAGESFARYRVWDAKRSLDYLTSRPEVDSERIGCTGCSGGGTLTTFIAALDPRIKVAAPACYMNSFRVLFSGPVGDSEQSLPKFLSSGLDQTDFVELFAPKPWLIASTLEDFFPIEGARQVYQEALGWYRIFGAQDRIAWAVGPGSHGTPLEVREAIYEWFLHWLNGGKGDPREEDLELLADHQLLVTPSGQVSVDLKARELHEIILEGFETRRKAAGETAFVEEVRSRIDYRPGAAPPFRVVGESVGPVYRTQELALETTPGLELDAALLLPRDGASRPADGPRRAVLVVETEKPPSARARNLAARGTVVLSLCPSGLPAATSSRVLLGDWLSNTRAWLIGSSLPAMRARDIMRGVDLLAAQPGVDREHIRAAASGVPGIWLLMAASADHRLGRIWLDRTPHSLRAALRSPVHRNLHDAAIFGLALHGDLEVLVRSKGASGSLEVLWTDPADWMGNVLPLGPPFRHRLFEQPDDLFLDALLR